MDLVKTASFYGALCWNYIFCNGILLYINKVHGESTAKAQCTTPNTFPRHSFLWLLVLFKGTGMTSRCYDSDDATSGPDESSHQGKKLKPKFQPQSDRCEPFIRRWNLGRDGDHARLNSRKATQKT